MLTYTLIHLRIGQMLVPKLFRIEVMNKPRMRLTSMNEELYELSVVNQKQVSAGVKGRLGSFSKCFM